MKGRDLDKVILPALEGFAPDALVTQLGSDGIVGDIVANLGLSLRGFERSVKRFRDLDVPWEALGGGGYDVGNVARAWTLAWATMVDADLPDEIPASWTERAAAYGVRVPSLRGPTDVPQTSERVMDALDGTIATLQDTVLPILREAGGGA